MADEIKTEVTLEELMESTLAMTDALAKLLIAKGIITDAEFKAQLECGAGELSIRAETPSLKITVPVFTSIANLPLDATNIVFLAAKNVARS